MNDKILRAVALYRASTRQQIDKDNNDIPTQKKIVRNFIWEKKWDLVREFVEGGISGYKISSNERDALQTIKAMAINKEFDILVVYMSDRLGRIADETPLVIRFLNQHNVRIWSVSEGEIKADSHVDKLMTFIRYWQSEGESIKTSKRVSDYQTASIEEGRFRGGSFLPYGYKLVNNGNVNFKGRPILDLVIDEKEAEIVKLIYNLSISKNYGQSRIAKYLNEHGYKTRKGKGWTSSTIQSILANPMYKGQLHMYSSLYQKQILSPIQENLVIIPEKTWEKNRQIVESRTYKKKYNNDDIRPKNTHGKLLLSGIAYCGYCGSPLTTMTAYYTWTTADGEKKRTKYYKYRCGSFYKKGAIQCEGQTTYVTTKIDPIVIDQTKDIIIELQNKELDKGFIEEIEQNIKRLNNNKNDLKYDLEEKYKELKALKTEVAKSLLGKSNFEPDMLKELIEEKNIEIEKIEKQLQSLELKIKKKELQKNNYMTLDTELQDWIKKFDEVGFDEKKAMLANILKRVDVYKEYVEMKFSIEFETYKSNTVCKNTQDVRTKRDNLQYVDVLEFIRKAKYVS